MKCTPVYVYITTKDTLHKVKNNSPNLFKWFDENNFRSIHSPWEGDIEQIPDRAIGFVFCSDYLTGAETQQFAQRCAEIGHIFFYQDRYISGDGRCHTDPETLIEKTQEMLERLHGK